jgi:hypothetical protein
LGMRYDNAGGMDVCLLRNFFFSVRLKSIHRGYRSSGGVVRSVACLERDRAASIVKRPWPIGGYCAVGKNRIFIKGLKTG